MRFVADLHIHSRFSRACARDLAPEDIHASAERKGLGVVATGDFTHPAWRAELEEKLVEAEPGLLRLREDLAKEADRGVPERCRGDVSFILSAEISNIYKQGDRTRKVHNVVFVPDLDAARRLSARLAAIGNVTSDGRPILGLASRDLLEMVLETHPEAFLVPAHIWTPWFSVLGAKSGFDSIDACYGDLAGEIFAVETGLSSDPPMNWRLSMLDRYRLISNSDAHSPAKLARECNVFETDRSYAGIRAALRTGDGLLGTIEFFPEEGKYHLDGHRACGKRMTPGETIAASGLCPACGKKVTVGVLHRVEELADRPACARPACARPYWNLVPLGEVVGQAHGVGAGSKKVGATCAKLLGSIGSELSILMDAPIDAIESVAGATVAEGIRRMRNGEVTIAAGYDGEYGRITLFADGERERLAEQLLLF
ncbi:MAG: hypothetical protein JXP34_00160 [Planctomycetes bacterium]|nr:hypothetical protein [Planctomycetota bacterium]